MAPLRWLLLLAACASAVACQAPGLADRKLSSSLRILCVAAHPDDEDGALLLWHSGVEGAESSVLYTTRGEGGQNAIGPELYRKLGVLREDEIAAACEAYDAQPFFAGFEDFGFSKRADEAFARWGGEEEVVRRFTELLRRLRPHRVFTNHTPDRGHGHHRATSLALREAVGAAADPLRFPEQLGSGQLAPWQVDALFERYAPAPGEEPVAEERILTLDYADLLEDGTEVGRRAYEGFLRHRTQGPWPTLDQWNRREGRYLLVDAPGGAPRVAALAAHRRSLPPLGTSGEGTDLFTLLANPREHGFEDRGELAGIYFASCGARPRVIPDRFVVARGEIAEVTLEFPLLEPSTAGELELRIHGPATLLSQESVRIGAGVRVQFQLRIDEDAPHTLPRDEVHYGYRDRRDRYPIRLRARWQPAGRAALEFDQAVPLDVSPPVLAAVEPGPLRVRAGATEAGVPGSLELQFPLGAPAGLQIREASGMALAASPRDLPADRIELRPARGLTSLSVPFVLHPGSLPRGQSTVTLEVRSFEPSYTVRFEVPLQVFSVEVPATRRVAFVASTDRSAEQALRTLGIPHAVLEARDLQAGEVDWSQFTTVILDVRVLGEHPVLREEAGRLREFVARGGTLLVEYHKSGEWNPYAENHETPAPFALTLSRDRVCEEEAPVEILAPDHPVLQRPNAIGPPDFEGWVQERGLYFPHKSYAPEYVELLSCHDQDEDPLPGGLLVAPSGEGWFIYCAYALHRQLRAGHPGAHRLFANLLALGEPDTHEAAP